MHMKHVSSTCASAVYRLETTVAGLVRCIWMSMIGNAVTQCDHGLWVRSEERCVNLIRSWVCHVDQLSNHLEAIRAVDPVWATSAASPSGLVSDLHQLFGFQFQSFFPFNLLTGFQ